MKIVIITDGNNILGLGHVYQSITLVHFLKKAVSDVDITFITKSEENVILLLRNTGFPVIQFPDDDSIFNSLKAADADVIIFDILNVNVILAKNIKENLRAKLVIMTNLTEANEYADITVLADIGSNFKNIRKENNITGKVEFWGPKYWILRPEFYDYPQKMRPSEIKKIMMIFGGADPCNYSTLVLKELLMMDSSFDIKIVIGAAFHHREKLDEIIKCQQDSTHKVEVIENMKNVAETMYKSDIVFASPGLSFFEALAVGTPVIGFHQNELQGEVYSNGGIPTLDTNRIHEIKSMIENKTFLFPDTPEIAAMEIGKGKDELIKEILN